MTTEDKLNQLDEFYARRTLLEADKKVLLEEVKVPEEILALMNNMNKNLSEAEREYQAVIENIDLEMQSRLSAVAIPEIIKDALAAIDAQRQAIRDDANKARRIAQLMADGKKEIVKRDSEAQVQEAFAAVDIRKSEIEAEFADKLKAFQDNIAKLEAEIKAEVAAAKKTASGDHWICVYTPGRITWNTDKMEAWLQDHPFLKEARKEGAGYGTIRRKAG